MKHSVPFLFTAHRVWRCFMSFRGSLSPTRFTRVAIKSNIIFIIWGKRLSRLFPPYFATIILITLVGYYLTTFLWGGVYDFQWRKMFANAFFAVDFIAAFDSLSAYFPDGGWINPVFKTLKVEFQFYLLIGLLFPLLNRYNWALIGFSVILLALGVYTASANTVLVNGPYFLIGIATFYIFEKGWKWEYALVLLLCYISLFGYYAWQDSIVAVIAFVLVLYLPTNFRFLNFTGKISYSYYLIHGLTGGWFLYFTSDTYLAINYPYLMVIFALIISWVGAFLMYFCIEKPSLVISKKIKYTS